MSYYIISYLYCYYCYKYHNYCLMMYQVMVSTEGITILKTISVNFIIIIAIAKGAFTIIIIAVVIIEYKNC